MALTRVIPTLLLSGRSLVKTRKFKDPVYIGDPINAIRIFNDKEVDELIVLDIEASRSRRKPDFALIKDIASECFMPVAYGGGINSLDDAQRIISLGIEKVVINTAALERPQFISELANTFGSQSVVVSIDVKRRLFGGAAVYSHAHHQARTDPASYARQMVNHGAGELFVTSVDRDGTETGFDIALIRSIAEAVRVPLIACGGAGTIEHLTEAVKNGGASAVAAGSMFVFHGRHRAVLISYPSPATLASAFAVST